MPFPDIPVTPGIPLIGFHVTEDLNLPADGSPLVVAFDVPEWHWSPFSWTPPRRTVHVTSAFATNSGVYGPNPPVISGKYGVIAGPAIGQYAPDYRMVRTLYPGRHYLVVRPRDPGAAGGTVSVSVD